MESEGQKNASAERGNEMSGNLKIMYARAVQESKKSQDPSTKVGAVIFDGGYISGLGVNHLAKGSPEEFWNDRSLKYPHVVHAEVSALIRAGKAQGATLVCSEHPCQSCAILAVEFGVSRIVCREEPWRDTPEIRESVEGAKAVFARAGVEVVYVV